MEIVRHCTERLPGGERLWRAAAREVGFKGTLSVYGFGALSFSKEEIHSSKRSELGITYGYFLAPDKILMFLDRAKCSDPAHHLPGEGPQDEFFHFCHELGH